MFSRHGTYGNATGKKTLTKHLITLKSILTLMRREYTCPETAVVPFVAEGMVANSLKISGDKLIENESEFLSDKKDMKNPIWSDGKQ